MKLSLALIAAGITICLPGCKEENTMPTCSEGTVNHRLLNNDLNPGAELKDSDRNDSLAVKIIQTADELFTHLEINYLSSNIDFEKETLIVGLIKTDSPVLVTDQTVESNCAANSMVLRTTIQRTGGVFERRPKHVFAIVPKIPDRTRVLLVVKKI